MADPRALHMRGLGTLDKVHADWAESAENDSSMPQDVLVVIDRLGAILVDEKLAPIAISMVLSVLNSRLDQHGRVLRLNDDGVLEISDKLQGADLQMFQDYIANV